MNRRVLVLDLALAVLLVAALGVLRGAAVTHELPEVPLEEVEALRASCETPTADVPGRLISSSVAVECPAVFDEAPVVVVGEVVGDVIHRAGGSWIQLNDDPYALEVGPLPITGAQAGTSAGLAVWLPDPLDDDLSAGRSDRRGDVLVVRGTFLRTDDGDGGGTSVRADGVRLLAPAVTRSEAVAPRAVLVTLALAAAAAAAWTRRGARR